MEDYLDTFFDGEDPPLVKVGCKLTGETEKRRCGSQEKLAVLYHGMIGMIGMGDIEIIYNQSPYN